MNKKPITMILCLSGVAGIYWLAQAGPQEPPAPTMRALDEIYHLLDAYHKEGLPYGVSKTGQTGCSDEDGSPISCTDTGQDGEYQAGSSVHPRFTDNRDGTVKDNLTGLIWLKRLDCIEIRNAMTWDEARTTVHLLRHRSCVDRQLTGENWLLTDGSEAGSWRLPNIRELQSLVDFGQAGPALPPDHPFVQVQWGADGDRYWSSTTVNQDTAGAWYVDFDLGGLSDWPKGEHNYVWPVRNSVLPMPPGYTTSLAF